MDIKKIKPVIKVYLKELKKKIKPQKVILFGSYARGTANKDSDIDLVILSDDFKKISFDKRLDLLIDAREHQLTRKYAMDIFGYTPKEYAQASTLTTLGEIKETGIVV